MKLLLGIASYGKFRKRRKKPHKMDAHAFYPTKNDDE